METLTFTCKIITPMFMAGADGKTPELRAASIKGALRFWWRACNGHLGLEEMRKKEQEIFGGVGGNQGNRSKVIIRVKDLSPEENGTTKPLPDGSGKYKIKVKHFDVNILEYLAYGTYEWDRSAKRNRMTRGYLEAGKRFSITISCPLSLVNEIKSIVNIISRTGGIGAKSRNGFGRFEVEEISNPVKLEDLFKGQRKDFTSFSDQSRVINIVSNCNTAMDTLAELGKKYKEIRGSMEPKHNYSKRKYLGAPLMEGKINRADLERHGKPIFFGIDKIEDETYRGYFLIMPYNYLGGEDHDKVKAYNSSIAKFISNAR